VLIAFAVDQEEKNPLPAEEGKLTWGRSKQMLQMHLSLSVPGENSSQNKKILLLFLQHF
jgi:hypothetical protein